MVLREGAELALILRAVQLSSEGIQTWIGTLVGLAAAVAVGLFFFKGTLKIPLHRFFAATTIILWLVTAQLALTGLHELSEAQWLPSSRHEMALIGPVVRNEIFFFVLIFGAAVLLILREWLTAVGCHHADSYRHCLFVTGYAVAFAQHLGMREGDQRRLTRAALLHDVGKAFIPVAILDKPGKLTDEEMAEIRRHPQLELLLDPELSVLLFRRTGWGPDDYEAWWRRVLEDQIAFVQPTTWRGERVARLCFVNPRTTIEHVRAILATLR